jgi:hypothetical protein
MNSLSWQDPSLWALTHFGQADLGDARRQARAVELGTALATTPAGSLPQQCEDMAALKAAYRFLHSPKISFSALCAWHWKNTMQFAQSLSATPRASPPQQKSSIPENAILFIQDATVLDYSAHKACQGLGPVGDGRGQGLMLHSCLAIVPPRLTIIPPKSSSGENLSSNGYVLGMAHQSVWARPDAAIPKPLKKRQERTEQDIWAETLTALGQVPPGAFYVSVADRGSDVLSYWQHARSLGWHLLSRLYHKRVCYDPAGQKQNLISWGNCLQRQSKRTIIASLKPKSPRVSVEISIGWSALTIVSSRTPSGVNRRFPERVEEVNLQEGEEQLPGYLVHCSDASGQVQWYLFTTVPIESIEDAWQIVDWYCRRWVIEEYHKCLKTGCGIEKCQVRDVEGLQVILGFLSLLAVRLLMLRDLSRSSPQILAREVVAADLIETLCFRSRLDSARLCLSEFWRRVAMLGGFLGRKSDGSPGWQTLWRGWLKLLDLAEGVAIGKQLSKCG